MAQHRANKTGRLRVAAALAVPALAGVILLAQPAGADTLHHGHGQSHHRSQHQSAHPSQGHSERERAAARQAKAAAAAERARLAKLLQQAIDASLWHQPDHDRGGHWTPAGHRDGHSGSGPAQGSGSAQGAGASADGAAAPGSGKTGVPVTIPGGTSPAAQAAAAKAAADKAAAAKAAADKAAQLKAAQAAAAKAAQLKAAQQAAAQAQLAANRVPVQVSTDPSATVVVNTAPDHPAPTSPASPAAKPRPHHNPTHQSLADPPIASTIGRLATASLSIGSAPSMILLALVAVGGMILVLAGTRRRNSSR